eukprot:8775217-Alexandrium_andersonii.AAC.1
MPGAGRVLGGGWSSLRSPDAGCVDTCLRLLDLGLCAVPGCRARAACWGSAGCGRAGITEGRVLLPLSLCIRVVEADA